MAGMPPVTGLIWQTASVTDDGHGGLRLAFPDPGACPACDRGRGCGAAHLARLFSRSSATLPLDAGRGYRRGDRVRVGIDGRWLVIASATAYLLPTVAFVAGTVAAHAWAPGHDGAALAAGVVTAAGAVVAVGRHAHRLLAPRLKLAPVPQPESGTLESAGPRAHLGCRIDAFGAGRSDSATPFTSIRTTSPTHGK